ncbi:hypothetical protein ACQEV4_35865 [Streptomyces shenzhenensis]|uniref:hypothetical protein n=1 Tax=Streptomyces shenzhenensis TaxID=943815 RepID=UPI003D94DE1A
MSALSAALDRARRADVIVTGVERPAREPAEATALVPAALTRAEAEPVRARAGLPRTPAAGRRHHPGHSPLA